MPVMRGALATTMLKVLKSFNAGEPLSVTRTVTWFVIGVKPTDGVQVKTPLAGLMIAPAGAPGSRLKVRLCAGRSGSVAVAVKVRFEPAVTVLLPMVASTGGRFTSLTVMVMISKALVTGEPLSVTR